MGSLCRNEFFRVLCVVVCFIMMSTAAVPGTSFADQDDPDGDTKLIELHADIQACQQPGVAGVTARTIFSEKYNVPMSEVPNYCTPNNKDFFSKAQILCSAEVNPSRIGTIGTEIWYARALIINYHCHKIGTKLDYALSFCIHYSEHCDHWRFSSICAEQKLSSCIKR